MLDESEGQSPVAGEPGAEKSSLKMKATVFISLAVLKLRLVMQSNVTNLPQSNVMTRCN